MSAPCSRCGFPSLRRSKLRSGDLFRIALLRFPVRCTTCMTRFFVPLRDYLKLRESRENK